MLIKEKYIVQIFIVPYKHIFFITLTVKWHDYLESTTLYRTGRTEASGVIKLTNLLTFTDGK